MCSSSRLERAVTCSLTFGQRPLRSVPSGGSPSGNACEKGMKCSVRAARTGRASYLFESPLQFFARRGLLSDIAALFFGLHGAYRCFLAAVVLILKTVAAVVFSVIREALALSVGAAVYGPFYVQTEQSRLIKRAYQRVFFRR